MLFINLIPCHRKKCIQIFMAIGVYYQFIEIWGVESGNTMSAIVVLFIIDEIKKNILLMLFIYRGMDRMLLLKLQGNKEDITVS